MLDSEFDGPLSSPGLMLWRVSNAWQSTQRRALKPFGLTHVQFVLLASLAWLPEAAPVTQRRLADYAQTDLMMTSQVLRVLEAKGLIERRAHPTDARARWLVPTPNGLAVVNSAVKAIEAADRQFFGKLGPNVQSFSALLGNLVPQVDHPTGGRDH